MAARLWLAPSLKVCEAGFVTPERASVAVYLTTAGAGGEVYQTGGAGSLIDELSFGAVRSTSKVPTVVLAELPATSVAVPVTLWSIPSPSVTGAVALDTPEPPSSAVKLTVGAPVARLYQPVDAALL